MAIRTWQNDASESIEPSPEKIVEQLKAENCFLPDDGRLFLFPAWLEHRHVLAAFEAGLLARRISVRQPRIRTVYYLKEAL